MLTPDDGAKYTIEFTDGGRLMRADRLQSRARDLEVERAESAAVRSVGADARQVPAGSMHDQIVKQWANIRSYVIKDGHLFLSLMADGGIYEFEPIKKSNR